jgi:CBS domain-containing protein
MTDPRRRRIPQGSIEEVGSMRRRVSDVMTRTVAVVAADTPFKEIARRLSEHRVAALPVVDARDRAIGIVSEADLLLKEERPMPEQAPRFIGRRRRAELGRAGGASAKEIMTSPVTTIGPDATLAEAARVMHGGGFRSMPVVDEDGRVVGIVSRRDLLLAFLRPDDDIRREIEQDVLNEPLVVEAGRVTVSVVDGVVTLEGRLERSSTIAIVVRMVDGVEGVVKVVNRLTSEFDDSYLRPVVMSPWGVVPTGAR